jgi:hypothetical protein
MILIENPAARLLAILEKGKTIPPNETCENAWIKILETQRSTNSLFFTRLAKVMELTNRSSKLLENLDLTEKFKRANQHWVNQVNAAFVNQKLNGQWETFKFWSTNSKSHAIYHEFGHFMHYTQDSALYLKLRGAEFTAEEALIAQQVSLYAATKPIEFIAEVFSKLATGVSVSDEVMSLYKQLNGYEL